MPSQGARTAMLLGGALVASLAGGSPASSQDLASATPIGTQVSFADLAGDQGVANAPTLNLNIRDEGQSRFAEFNNDYSNTPAVDPDRRELEFELGADHDVTGIPLDVSIAQRASFDASDDGNIDRYSRGSEVRIGRALGDPNSGMSASESRIYVFAASDDEALQWRPGQNMGNFSLDMDTVQVGDRQAGVTYQRGAMQASLAYVEREISARVGRTEHSDNEQFAGFTLTMKH